MDLSREGACVKGLMVLWLAVKLLPRRASGCWRYRLDAAPTHPHFLFTIQLGTQLNDNYRLESLAPSICHTKRIRDSCSRLFNEIRSTRGLQELKQRRNCEAALVASVNWTCLACILVCCCTLWLSGMEGAAFQQEQWQCSYASISCIFGLILYCKLLCTVRGSWSRLMILPIYSVLTWFEWGLKLPSSPLFEFHIPSLRKLPCQLLLKI